MICCGKEKKEQLPPQKKNNIIKRATTMAMIMNDKPIKQAIFNFLWKYNYIFNNEDCDCHFRKKTITFKNRYGKRFDRRFLKYAEIFGFETTSGPTADLTILPESQEKFDEINQLIITTTTITNDSQVV